MNRSARRHSRASRKRRLKTVSKKDTEPPPVTFNTLSRLFPRPLSVSSSTTNASASANALKPVPDPVPAPISARTVTLRAAPSLQELLTRAQAQYQQDYLNTYGKPAPSGLNTHC